ncbi:hypothetical protein NQ314_017755 [Rhamnusium bicolor]|uniref:Nuclease HARBI1 n=1 Tax=Rhamnusium bicolor TaxID=1586634 RepID=A0AAV8WTR7_9CUCU|nr:hypothetical protein NQ314_017755 [Rhamnusium bicolor]
MKTILMIFFVYLDHLEVIEAHRRRDRLFKRYIRGGENPLEFYEEVEFRKRYRFSKHVVTNVILPLILDGLQIEINNRGLPVSPLIKLLICLRFYATGNFQNVTGDLRKVRQATVSQTIKQVSVLLAEQLGNFIKFPDNENEQRINIIKNLMLLQIFHQYQVASIALTFRLEILEEMMQKCIGIGKDIFL